MSNVVEVDPSWDESAVAMPETPTGSGQYPIPLPTELPAGHVYDVIVYVQAGGSPANSDAIDTIVDNRSVLKRSGKWWFWCLNK